MVAVQQGRPFSIMPFISFAVNEIKKMAFYQISLPI